MDCAFAQTLSNYSELLIYQEIEKATGVKVEFIYPEDWAPDYYSWLKGEKGKEEGGQYGAQAKKDMYDEILKIRNDAYQRYLKNNSIRL